MEIFEIKGLDCSKTKNRMILLKEVKKLLKTDEKPSKEKLEKEILEKQRELLTAKTEALKAEQRIEELYADAIDAMKEYSGKKIDHD